MESESERRSLHRIEELRASAERMPRGHAVLQLGYAVMLSAYVGVFAFTGSSDGGVRAFGGTAMTLLLPPIIVSSALVSGATERFGGRLRSTRADGVGAAAFAVLLVGLLAWGVLTDGYPAWVALAAAVLTLVIFSIRPLRVWMRTTAPADPERTQVRALPLPARLTTVFLGVFFGLVCAVVFEPALGWLVTMLGLIIVLIALAARGEPWSFLVTGYEWRFPQWIGFGVATLIMFLLALLIVATDVVTPGIAAAAGGLVAASLVLCAFIPRGRRGASEA